MPTLAVSDSARHVSTAASHPELVVLRQGLSVTREAIELLWDFEARGFTIRADGEDLLIGPARRLTSHEEEHIRARKWELVRLVRLCDDEAPA